MFIRNDLKGVIKMEEQHSSLGYSAVSTFNTCPYQYKLRYIDGVEMLDEYEPTDALKLGTALHKGIETDVQTAIKEYYASYPIINNLHVHEAMKLEVMIKKVKEVIPDGQHEVFIQDGVFKGTIDLLVPNDDNTFDMYDFKYSNNVDKYLESPQLSIYKHYCEKSLGITIKHLYFVFAQKTMIRQKKTETLEQFRTRLWNTLKTMQVRIEEVQFDADKVLNFVEQQVKILTTKDFEKQPSRLCDWCEYKDLCEENEMGALNMALPSTKRVEVEKASKKKVWIYGVPFSGKTTFADQAPTPLNLNTDGNVKYVTMPRLAIKDEVTTEGRITNRKFAWDVFKDAVADLEKGSEFETIVVDLLEDVYDYSRVKVCDDKGWEHESDDSFKAYDIVRNEFLRTIKRLLNLDYNIILISHEDASKDVMKKGGDKITSIQPNVPEKVAKKLSGMVDLVGRVVVDGNKRYINFKSDDVVFGGGRLQGIKTTEIPLEWDALCKVYDEAIGNLAPMVNVEDEPEQEPEQDATKVEEVPEEPVRRTRRKRED